MLCRVCGKSFEVYGSKKRVVCSFKCVGVNNAQHIAAKPKNKITTNCVYCKAEMKVFPYKFKRCAYLFCSRKCKGKFLFPSIRPKLRSKCYKIETKNNGSLKLRSRWEACLVEDFLDKNELDWEYETQTFSLIKGDSYTPDFYIKNCDTYIEVKGGKHYDRRNVIDRFKKEYPHIRYIVAYKQELEQIFRLDLSQKRLTMFNNMKVA